MKIFILDVDRQLQPLSQPVTYPTYNDDYGVEQDFVKFLSLHPDLIANDPSSAIWHYLPVYWTRWHLNHNYAKQGLDKLQELVDKAVINSDNTFTICQYDDGPLIDLGKCKIMLASRNTNIGIDIPLLAKPLKLPMIKPRKMCRASFIGRLNTHPIRADMSKELWNLEGINIVDKSVEVKAYIREMLKSYVALCPRGYGGSSFRFYEAMQLGLVPFLIGDRDTRPFKDQLPWGEFSLYTDNPAKIESIISQYSEQQLLKMGQIAKKIWNEALTYQKWCNLALKELE